MHIIFPMTFCRLSGVISYEVNTYLQYVLCDDDGVAFVPSVALVSVHGHLSECMCRGRLCIMYVCGAVWFGSLVI